MDWFGDTFFIISIHAPREGRDWYSASVIFLIRYHFNPRAPRGARLVGIFPRAINDFRFQSTRPARGATPLKWQRTKDMKISIHAPREGRDQFLNLQ